MTAATLDRPDGRGLDAVLALGRAADEFARSPEAAEPFLRGLADFAGCETALLAAADPVTGGHRLLANSGYSAQVADHLVDGYAASCPGYAFSLRCGLPVRMCDIPFDYRETPTYQEVLQPAGFLEGVTVCLYTTSGRYTGLLTLSSSASRPVAEDTRALMAALASRLATAADLRRAPARDELLLRPDEVVLHVASRPGRVLAHPGVLDDLPLDRAQLIDLARLVCQSARDRIGFYQRDGRGQWWAWRGQRTATPRSDGIDVVVTARRENPPYGLSARELDILSLMVRGLANAEVAAELHVSLSTVKTHVEHVLDKLGTATRAGAVSMASDRLLLSWQHLR